MKMKRRMFVPTSDYAPPSDIPQRYYKMSKLLTQDYIVIVDIAHSQMHVFYENVNV